MSDASHLRWRSGSGSSTHVAIPSVETAVNGFRHAEHSVVPRYQDDFTHPAPHFPLSFEGSAWLLARNHELYQLLTEQGKKQQDQAILLNEFQRRIQYITQSRDSLERWHWELANENRRLANALDRANHALFVQRHQHAIRGGAAEVEKELLCLSRQEAPGRRESGLSTQGQLAQITQALVTAARSSGPEEILRLRRRSFEATLKQNEPLRREADPTCGQSNSVSADVKVSPLESRRCFGHSPGSVYGTPVFSGGETAITCGADVAHRGLAIPRSLASKSTKHNEKSVRKRHAKSDDGSAGEEPREAKRSRSHSRCR